MKVKTPLAAVAFATIAGFAGMAFAASNAAPTTTNAPCVEQMRADYAELAQAMNLTGPAKQAFDKYVASRQEIFHFGPMYGTNTKPATASARPIVKKPCVSAPNT